MDDLNKVMDFLEANRDKQGTPEYQVYVEAFKRLSAAPAAADPTQVPYETLQGKVKDLPEIERVKLVNAWADAQEKKAAAEGGTGRYLGDIKRSVVRGIPGGTFADEAQAAISSRLPAGLDFLWSGAGDPYEKIKALEDARTRRFEKESPVASFAGNIAGALPFGLTGSIGKRVAFDTAAGALSGAGEGDNAADRARNALISGGMSGVLSGVLNKAGQFYNRFTQQSPEVVGAAERSGVDLPFFATSPEPSVQAAGRRAAQFREPVAEAWEGAKTGLANRGGQIVSDVVGAPIETAPNVAGRSVVGQLETATKSLSDQMAALAEQTSKRVPEDFRGDMPKLRGEIQTIIGERTAAGAPKPEAGLGAATGIATMPGGPAFPGVARFATETGQRLGQPDLVPRKLPKADEARLYGATRQDQRRMVEQAVGRSEGPWSGVEAGETFQKNLAKQAQIADVRSDLASAAGKAPEQLIAKAYNAATVKGAGTRLDDLTTLVTSLPPEQQRQLGAGVFAHIQNVSNGSPEGIASRIAAMPKEARDLLFGAGSELSAKIDDMVTLASRIGDINQMRHVGSAASTPFDKLADVGAVATSPLAMAGVGIASQYGVPGAAYILPAQAAIYAARKGRGAAQTQLYNRGLPLPAVTDPAKQDLATMLASAVSREGNRWPIGYGR